MNLFSGARRLAFVASVLWIVGVSVFHFTQKNQATYLELRVPDFGAQPIQSDSCLTGVDGVRYKEVKENDLKFTARLCFVATRVSNGLMLIPYMKVEENVMLNSVNDAWVSAYMDNYSEDFKPTLEDIKKVRDAENSALWSQRGWSLAVLVGVLIVFWCAVWVAGWIARGFLGVPTGRDHRVNQVADNPRP